MTVEIIVDMEPVILDREPVISIPPVWIRDKGFPCALMVQSEFMNHLLNRIDEVDYQVQCKNITTIESNYDTYLLIDIHETIRPPKPKPEEMVWCSKLEKCQHYFSTPVFKPTVAQGDIRKCARCIHLNRDQDWFESKEKIEGDKK